MTLELGDRAPETAEGYFWYGKSLLEVSRNQQDFLGTKAENEDVENVDPESEQKEEVSSNLESVREELAATSVEKEGSSKASDVALPAEGGDEEQASGEKESVESGANADENEEANGETAEKEDLDEDEGENEDEGEDDVTDQQLAYEMFELARGIFESLDEPTPETETKRAECHMSIGEISGENGQIEDSIVEYDAALEIFEKCLPKDKRRRIAEVYFSLGCAQDAIYHYSKSLISFERALEIMHERVEFIKAKPEESRKPADNRELTSLTDTVVPELKERIEDARMSGKKHEADKELIKQVLLQKSTTNAFDAAPQASSSNPSSSINHLVKRKRKTPASETASQGSVGILEPSAKK